MLLGAHVSIASGMYKAFERGEGFGCEAIQIFTKSARQWAAKEITDEIAAAFKEARSSSPIEKVVVHDSYLINLAGQDQERWEKSVDAFIVEVERAELVGADYLVLHPGYYKEATRQEALDRVVEAFGKTLDAVGKVNVMILVENTAGMGHGLGAEFFDTGDLLDAMGDDTRFGGCFDTCHAFVAGHDLVSDYDGVFSKYDDEVGLERLKVFHLNDALFKVGSGKDRHSRIGEGFIGADVFTKLVNDNRFKSIPGILETPVENDENDSYGHEIVKLRSYVKGKNTRKKIDWGEYE